MKKIYYWIISAVIIILIVGVSAFLILNQKRILKSDADSILYYTDKEFLDEYDYVFIGQVKGEVETKLYDGTGVDIPYTIHNLEIVEYLKGTGDKECRICFCGGKLYLNTWSLYSENDEILQKSKYYLFFANKANEANKRLKKDDFILYQNQQKILLEDYDTSTSYLEQKKFISDTILRYKNVIDKVKEYELNVPILDTKEEIVKAYDTMFIWTAGEAIYRSNQHPEEDITIPQVRYHIGGTIFKGSLENIQYINFLGVNYWYDEDPVGFGLPKQNHTYLVFGNVSNTVIRIEAKHQIIELEGYDTNKAYDKQTNEIKDILQSYTSLL